MSKNLKMTVKGVEIAVSSIAKEDYFSLTDIARYRDAERSDYILQNWMRNRSTIEFMGLWESFHNPNFNPIEFDGFRLESGANSFSLTPKRWIEATGAIGVYSKPGRYGGTFAHKDIAFEFATWISAEFKFYLITEFQRLQKEAASREAVEWSVGRTLSKVNYKIHTDSIQENLIPMAVSIHQVKQIYANEADLLNVALFGQTSAQWRGKNPASKAICAIRPRWSSWWSWPTSRASTPSSSNKASGRPIACNCSMPRRSSR